MGSSARTSGLIAAILTATAPAAAGSSDTSGARLDVPQGPWRQLIRYQPGEGRDSGISLWISEASIVTEGSEGPARTRQAREVHELWVNHGTARLAGQAYRLERNRYHCGEGDMVRLGQAAFAADGERLITVAGDGERIPLIPHSAEFEVQRAVCDSGTIARRGATAATVAEAVNADSRGPDPAAPTNTLAVDLDADGRPEIVRAQMRPHSMRIDVELVPSRDPSRPFNIIAVAQPPTGPLVHSSLRSVPPNTYLYACERQENRDRTPCRGNVAAVTRGGVEVVTPGQPSLLLWLPDSEPRIVRLPAVPGPTPQAGHD